jgi:diguanylate cyclase (GGDEF)-like protein
MERPDMERKTPDCGTQDMCPDPDGVWALPRKRIRQLRRSGTVSPPMRVKVTGLLTLAGVALICISGLAVFYNYKAEAEWRERARANSVAEMLGHAAARTGAMSEMAPILAAMSAAADIELAAITDARGIVVAASRPEWMQMPLAQIPDRDARRHLVSAYGELARFEHIDPRYIDFATTIDLPGGEKGSLLVRLDTVTDMTNREAAAWNVVSWLAALVILSVLTISLLMQRLVVGPIEALRNYAERRERGGLVSIAGSSEEIGVVMKALAESFQATSASEARLADLAQTDGLTGLGNRLHFRACLDREISRAERDGSLIGVMILNLDKFKDVNDTLGHDSGDMILQYTADVLRNCQRDGDTIARLGADEFGVVLSGIRKPEEAIEFASRFVRAVGAPFRMGGHELHQTACVGLTLYPQDGRDADVLLKNADLALSRAKTEGSGTCVLYRHELHLRAMERNSIERDLRMALAQGQFLLFYQPKVDIRTGHITGAEALIRWRHPERGLVPPDLFIPVAERCGFIADLTKWVLDEACRQNRAWQDEGLPRIGMAVNVTAVDLRRPDLTDTVANTLVRHGLSPQYLELEVTESMVMRDVDVVIGTLRRLRSLGVGIGIDDFGTGYSSLAYLKRFPVKRLKIDRSFVRDIADAREGRIIPKVIIDLAHSLGVNVLAEGVETVMQLEILRDLGCEEAQGYLLGRPMPAEEFGAFLQRAPEGGVHPDAAMRKVMGAPAHVKPLPGAQGSAA